MKSSKVRRETFIIQRGAKGNPDANPLLTPREEPAVAICDCERNCPCPLSASAFSTFLKQELLLIQALFMVPCKLRRN